MGFSESGFSLTVFTVKGCRVMCQSSWQSQPLRASSHIEILDLEGEDKYGDGDRDENGREGIQVDTWIGWIDGWMDR